MPPFAPIPASLPATVPFVGPEELERQRGRPFRARLGANELTLPPSPLVMDALAQAAQQEGAFYPDPPSRALTEALAEYHGQRVDTILCGEGIDGLLGLCVRLFMAPDERAVTSAGAYPTFNYHVAGFGGLVETVPYRNDREDPEALAERARETNARLVYLSNPDNPMGSWVSHAEVEALVDALPENCILLLDEAYAEFHIDPAARTPMDFQRPNLIRLRTFSKAYGMAGMRLGYAMAAPEIIAGFDRIRNHFGINRPAQAAGIAALSDSAHLDATLNNIAAGRERLASIATANGLTPLPSATNFVTMDCGRSGDHARRVLAAILARDVFVRMPGIAPLDRCIRVSVGTGAEIDLLEAVLPEALADAQQAL